MKQSEIFLAGEGERWLKRNKKKLTGDDDPVLKALETYKIQPNRVVEIGCSNGWRLKSLRDRGWLVAGVEPGQPDDGYILNGAADDLPFQFLNFDVVIYGWCLYLCDPEDYFKIAAEGDRVLADGGFLIIYDFCTDHPYKVPYKHKKGIYSHHYDFSKLWLSHPAYSLYGRTIHGETSVTILHKDLENAFRIEK